MKKFKLPLLILLTFVSLNSFCQGNDNVEMADLLRKDGKIYTVVIALVVILTGMILFLVRVDRKLFRLEKQFEKRDPS
jgi:hypothetical protein